MTPEIQNEKPAPWGFDAERLNSLWQRKGVFSVSAAGVPSRLSRDEWVELVRLVQAGLAGARFMVDLRDAGYLKTDVINMFISSKLLSASEAKPPIHVGALREYFFNYQIDLSRSGARHRAAPARSCDSCDENNVPESEEIANAPETELFGLRRSEKVASFFNALTADQQALIAYVQCRDESVLTVAQACAIKSGSYQAKQLGIVLDKTKPAGEWFRKSKLGIFLEQELGIPVSS